LLALRRLLGLDVVNGPVRSRPPVPKGLGRLRLRNIGARGTHFDP
jgi:hypothetical protein